MKVDAYKPGDLCMVVDGITPEVIVLLLSVKSKSIIAERVWRVLLGEEVRYCAESRLMNVSI